MVRTQIQLTEEQSHQLKHLAVKQGVSVAELVRRSVDSLIKFSSKVDEKERVRRAIETVGKFHSGKNDISLHHDKYLMEAYSK